MAIPKTDEGLKRVIGLSGIALTIVNYTIGASIFILPAFISIQLGAFGIFAYVFCGIMLGAIMLCYVEIGSKITTTGGTYAYVVAAFGEFPGFVINWLLFFGWAMLSGAALMNIVADSLAILFPAFLLPWSRALLYFILLSVMVVLNVRSAEQGVSFIKWSAIINLLPLAGIIIFGFAYIKSSNLHWEHLPTITSFGNTSLILFFAFAGFESALSASGEISNPKRTIPRGILLGGGILLIVYLLIQLVAQGVLGTQMETFKDAPLAAVAEKIVGPVGGTIILLAAAYSCLTSVSCDLFTTPRILFAGAHDGIFPKILGKVHPKFATPYIAISLYAILIFIFSIAGGFQQLAILASASILLIYLAVILATIKLRLKKQDSTEKTFRMPGGLIIPFIGIASIIWLLTSLGKWEILSTIIFIAIVSVIYLVMKKLKVRRGHLISDEIIL
ncbi:MAG: amino acid permease [Ginsengibacter sp.]